MQEHGFRLVDDFENSSDADLIKAIKNFRGIFQLFSAHRTGAPLVKLAVVNNRGETDIFVLNDTYEDPISRAHVHAHIVPMANRLVAACDKRGKGKLVREAFADVVEHIPALSQSENEFSQVPTGRIIQVNFRRS